LFIGGKNRNKKFIPVEKFIGAKNIGSKIGSLNVS
jgi:hypothetical protein